MINDLAFDSSVSSLDKRFIHFLLLRRVCRGVHDEERYLPKNSSPVEIFMFLTHGSDGILEGKQDIY